MKLISQLYFNKATAENRDSLTEILVRANKNTVYDSLF